MHNRIGDNKLREFGFLIGLGLPLIIGWLLPLIFGHEFRLWTLTIALPFIILSTIKPSLLFYPYKFWMRLGDILGWINSRLILGLIFVIILLPLSIIMRATGYDPLSLKKNKQKTYRRVKENTLINLKKIF